MSNKTIRPTLKCDGGGGASGRKGGAGQLKDSVDVLCSSIHELELSVQLKFNKDSYTNLT